MPERPTEFEIEGGRELTMVQLMPAYAGALLNKLGFSGSEVLLPLTARPVRDALIAELIRRLDEPNVPTTLREWKLGVVLGNLARKALAIAATTKSAVLTSKALDSVNELIASNPETRLSVATLAEAVGLTPRRFSTEFREATGLPVHQYILAKRADRAMELLTGTNLPLSQVAAQVGFSHQAHMSRVLRRISGRTPGQIRRSREGIA